MAAETVAEAVAEALQPEPCRTSAFRHTRSAGTYKDYLCGLDHLRELVAELESQLEESLDGFYTCDKDSRSEESYNSYLRTVNTRFTHCNHALAAQGAGPVIVDGQTQIAVLINELKQHNAVVEPDTVTELTVHWEKLKFASGSAADDC